MQQNKRFLMPYGIHTPPMKKVFRWKLRTLFQKRRALIADDAFRLHVKPINRVELKREDDFIVWLGHATFYIQLDGIRILTDPVFGDIPMVRRLVPFPIAPELLDPDIILISHGHYDHLDQNSLAALEIVRRRRKVVLPLKLSGYLPKETDVSELGWYDCYRHANTALTVTALPASHWHRRGLFDFNRALWCSFLIESNDKRIFFAGDTAFDSHFAEIAAKIEPPDIALMPIGAYQPADVMQSNHMNPEEAVQAAEILNARVMIPYHYGTFKLSDEPVGEPHSWISKLAEEKEVKIMIPGVGEFVDGVSVL